MRNALTSLLIVVFLICLSFADVPMTVNYQGKLFDSSTGGPIDGTRAIGYRLYKDVNNNQTWDDAPTDSIVWEQIPANETIDNGLFNDTLDFSTGYQGSYDFSSVFGSGNDLFLIVYVGDAGTYTDFTGTDALGSPEPFRSTPYAFYAQNAISSANLQDGTSANQTLRWDGSKWAYSDALTNDGTDITATGSLNLGGNLDFTSSPGYINSVSGGALDLYSDQGIIARIDADGTGGTSTFKVEHDAGTDLFTVGEAGYVQIVPRSSSYSTARTGGLYVLSNGTGTDTLYFYDNTNWQPIVAGDITGNYIQNQYTSAQSASWFISGKGRVSNSTASDTAIIGYSSGSGGYGIMGISNASGDNNYGYLGGADYAVFGAVNAAGEIGVYGVNTSTSTSGDIIGVRAAATGSGGGTSTHYGVYGEASGGGTNIGGYFSPMIVIAPQGSAPSGTEGALYSNTDHNLYYYNGSAWQQIMTGGSITLQQAYNGGNTITTDGVNSVSITAGDADPEALYVAGSGGGNAIKTNGHIWMQTGNLSMDAGNIYVNSGDIYLANNHSLYAKDAGSTDRKILTLLDASDHTLFDLYGNDMYIRDQSGNNIVQFSGGTDQLIWAWGSIVDASAGTENIGSDANYFNNLYLDNQIIWKGTNDGTLQSASLTAARTWTLPDASGTIALTSDIPASGNYIQNQYTADQSANWRVSGKGKATNSTDSDTALVGVESGATSYGVYGEGSSYGIYGVNTGDNNIGYLGGDDYGVYGSVNAGGEYGVYGKNSSTSTSADYAAIKGELTGTGHTAVGILAYYDDATTDKEVGVYGEGGDYAIYGKYDANHYGFIANSDWGIYGVSSSSSGAGIGGYGTGTDGIYGESDDPDHSGLYAVNTNASGTGIITAGNNVTAIYLTGGSGIAAVSNNIGIYGKGDATSNSWGVYGNSAAADGIGVAGKADNDDAGTAGTDYVNFGIAGIYGFGPSHSYSSATAAYRYGIYGSFPDGSNYSNYSAGVIGVFDNNDWGALAYVDGNNYVFGGYFSPMIGLAPQSTQPTGTPLGGLYVRDGGTDIDTLKFYDGAGWQIIWPSSSGGITDINSQTGPSITMAASGTGLSVSSASNTITYTLNSGNSSSQIPISNGTVCTNLNADLLDGQHGSYYLDNTDNQTLSLSTNQLTISGGNTVTFSGWDIDASNDITTSTSAGGDLTGTYPNPTVVGLQGRSVSSTAPSDGQVLTWNNTANEWQAQAVPGDNWGSQTAVTDATLTGNGTSSSPLSVVYGSSANTAAEGNNTITITAGTGLSGGGTITIGAGGSVSLSNSDAGSSQNIFKRIQNSSGTTQFSAGSNNDYLQFAGTGYASVSFDAANHRITINATGDGTGTDNQTLSFSNPNLSISGGNTVDISAVNTDNQTLSLSTNQLTISGGNTVTFSGWDIDASNDITTSTSAGGDLTGTYPNPTVVGLQGRSVSSTAPSDGQVLTWNNTANEWQAQAVPGDNWGTQTVQTDATLSGNGTSGSPLSVTDIPAGDNDYIQNQSATDQSASFRISGNGYIAGNVGIGTTSPSAKLDVAGTAEINGQLDMQSNRIVDLANPTNAQDAATKAYVDAHIASGLTGSGSSNYVARWTSASNLSTGVLYDDGTNVGIGTTSPSAKLEVNGDFKIGERKITSKRYDQSNFASTGWYRIATASARAMGTFMFEAGGTNTFQKILVDITGGGYGVGNNILVLQNSKYNTGPIRQLRVSTNSGQIYVDLYLTDMQTDLSVNIDQSIQSGYWTLVTTPTVGATSGGTDEVVVDMTKYHTMQIFSSEGSPSLITNGNVGIGTTSPTEKLDVEGNIEMNSNQINNVATPTTGASAVGDAVSTQYLNGNPNATSTSYKLYHNR